MFAKQRAAARPLWASLSAGHTWPHADPPPTASANTSVPGGRQPSPTQGAISDVARSGRPRPRGPLQLSRYPAPWKELEPRHPVQQGEGGSAPQPRLQHVLQGNGTVIRVNVAATTSSGQTAAPLLRAAADPGRPSFPCKRHLPRPGRDAGGGEGTGAVRPGAGSKCASVTGLAPRFTAPKRAYGDFR